MLIGQGQGDYSNEKALRCEACGQYLGVTRSVGPLAQSITAKHRKRCHGAPLETYGKAAPLSVFSWAVRVARIGQ